MSEFLVYSLYAVYGLFIVASVGAAFGVAAPAIFTHLLALSITLLRFTFAGLASADAIYYDRMAIELVSGGGGTAISAGKEGFPLLLAGMYGIFGHDPILGLWVNAIACGLTVAFIAGIADRLGLPTRPAAWLFSLYPATYVWGTLLLREAVVWLLLAMVVYAAAGIVTGRGRMLINVIILGFAFVLLLPFRGSVGILVTVAVILAIFVTRRVGVGLYAILAVATVVIYLTPLADQVDGIFERNSIDRIGTTREALERTAGSGFSTSGGVMEIVTRVAPRVLFGPFVWDIGQVGVVGVADGLLWLALIVLVVRGVKVVRSRRDLSVIFFPVVALLVVLIVGSGNYGTLVRLRTQVAILLVPIAANGLRRVSRGARDRMINNHLLRYERMERLRHA